MAIVATTEPLDLKSERGVGVARFVRDTLDAAVAEAAVTVVDGEGSVAFDVPLASVEVDGALSRSLRVVAEHMNAFLRRLLPPTFSSQGRRSPRRSRR